MTVGREELIESYVPNVKIWARRIGRKLPKTSLVDADDLFGAGLRGLCQAADSFDESRGFKFKTLAQRRVVGEMMEELRRIDYLSKGDRRKVKAGLAEDVRFESVDAPLALQLKGEDSKDIESKIFVKELMEGLDDVEMRVIEGLFFEGKDSAELGREMGRSQSGIRLIRDRVLESLRQKAFL